MPRKTSERISRVALTALLALFSTAISSCAQLDREFQLHHFEQSLIEGDSFSVAGRYQEALRSYQRALADLQIAEPGSKREALLQARIANTSALAEGKTPPISEVAPEDPSVPQTLRGAIKMANKLKKQKSYSKAIDLLKPLVDEARLADSAEQREGLRVLSSCYMSMKNYVDAEKSYVKLLRAQQDADADPTAIFETVHRLATISLKNGQPDGALKYCSDSLLMKAAAKASEREIADVHLLAGRAHRDKHAYEDAIAELKLARAHARDTGDSEMILDIDAYLARTLAHLNEVRDSGVPATTRSAPSKKY